MSRHLLLLFWMSACAPEPAASVDVVTEAGLYALHLSPSADPFVAGEEVELEMELSAEGASVEGASLGLEVLMPSMGHGITDAPHIEELGGGLYLSTWVFSMPGAWEVTIEVSADPGEDRVVVPYEVQ